MKRILIAAGVFSLAFGFVSCGGAKGDDPGHAYMPDMYYSRAYETYGYNDVGGEFDSLKKRGITYTGMPVPTPLTKLSVLSQRGRTQVRKTAYCAAVQSEWRTYGWRDEALPIS